MKDFIFDIQRFANYVVNANADSGTYYLTKDGADAGIVGTFYIDIGSIDLTSSLTLSSGDSLTLSKSPETADINVIFNLGGAGNYSVNGFNFTANGATVANAYFDNTGSRYIYPGFGLILTDAGIVYNGVTYRKNSSASGDSIVDISQHTSGETKIWLTNAEVVNVPTGLKFYVEPEQMNGTDAAGQLIVDGIKINYDKDCDISFIVTNNGISFYDYEGDLIFNFDRSSGYNVINADTSTETISESYVENILSSSNGTYNYTGGDASISNYSKGEKINLVSKFKGIGFSSSDFKLKSATGSLTIQNVRDKVIDVAMNDRVVAQAYLASGAGEIDRSGQNYIEVLLGANNLSNTITAGNGSSTLWGGIGGEDILNGGNGKDTFFFGKNDGADIINNASSSDTINLYNASLADILNGNISISGSQISIGFNNGNKLTVNGTENLSAAFKLGGSKFQYNFDTSKWQKA